MNTLFLQRWRPLLKGSFVRKGVHPALSMLLGPRTRSGSRDEHMKTNAAAGNNRVSDEELQRLKAEQRHSSSALEGLRSNAFCEQQKEGYALGSWGLEKALSAGPSRIYAPAMLTLLGMVAACTLLLVSGVNPITQLKRLWSIYLSALSTAPLLTKMCTAGVCTLLGDMLAQILPFLLKPLPPPNKGNGAVLDLGSSVTKPGSGAAPSGILGQRTSNNVKSLEVAESSSPIEPGSVHNSEGVLPGFKYDPARAARFFLFSVFLATPVAHQWFAFLDEVIIPEAPTSPLAVVLKMISDQLLMTPFMTSVFFATMTALEGHPDRALSTVKTKIRPTLKANYLLWPAAHLINFGFVPLDLRILYVNVVAIAWTVYLSSVAASKSA